MPASKRRVTTLATKKRAITTTKNSNIEEVLNWNSNVNSERATRKRKHQSRLNAAIKELDNLHLPTPGFYLIHEIPYTKFLFCVKRLFELIEKKLTPDPSHTKMEVEDEDEEDTNPIESGYDDLFIKSMFMAQTPLGESEWRNFERERRFQNALSACMGDFHEELAGKFPGWRTLHTGHWSGVDVVYDKDRNYYMEWKNRAEYSSKRKVYQSFQHILNRDNKVQVMLVHVNVPFDWKPPPPILKSKEGIIDLTKPKYEGRVHIVSGQQAYKMLSGSETFYDRLAKTFANVFQDSKFKDLIYRTKMSMNESY
jgi:hypothetical protein